MAMKKYGEPGWYYWWRNGAEDTMKNIKDFYSQDYYNVNESGPIPSCVFMDLSEDLGPTQRNMNIGSSAGYAKCYNIADGSLENQLKINQAESELLDMLATPAGLRLYRWQLDVKRTWWYKFFSRFHKDL